jgi:hypothetical protein
MTAYYMLLLLFLNSFLLDYQPGKYSVTKFVAIDYNLSNPDKTYVLPDVLKEVSGITEIDGSTIACIQDENGILYIYDLSEERIKKQYTFCYNGDYEGIARVDKTIYVLRSDGMLCEIANYESGKSTPESYFTGIPARDNEGLCFDQKANRLLIAPKSNDRKDSENKDHRCIYAFNLQSKKLSGKPLYIFDLSVIRDFAMENKIKVPMKKGKEGHKNIPDLEFKPSEIGVHPFSNKLFVLSGMEHILYVFNADGTIEYIEKLDPGLFIQPEGITFLKNGDMLISNEGRNKKATILRFNYRQK